MKRLLLTLPLLAVCVACPGTRNRPPGTPGNQTNRPDTGTSSTTDAGMTMDGGLTGRGGFVLLAQSRTQNSLFISGAFGDNIDPADLLLLKFPGCTEIASAGACMYVDCSGVNVASDAAGTITITTPGGQIQVDQTAAGQLYSSNTSISFNPGEAISIGAVGDVVGGFAGTVVAPNTPADTLPSGTIQSTQPLDVTWTAGGSETTVLVGIAPTTTPTARIVCSAAANAGTVSVDASLLQMIAGSAARLALSFQSSTLVNASTGEQVILLITDDLTSDVDVQ